MLSEFRQDSSAKNYNSTPNTVIKNKSVSQILPEKKKNIYGHRVSLSSSNNTDNDRSHNTSWNRNKPIWKDFITSDVSFEYLTHGHLHTGQLSCHFFSDKRPAWGLILGGGFFGP